MTITFGSSAYSHLRRVMIFIDGGYFKRVVDRHFGDGKSKDPEVMSRTLNHLISDILRNSSFAPNSKPELIRSYYYDAKFSPEDDEFKDQNNYFEEIRGYINYPFEMKFGRLIRAGKDRREKRQKGVDVLLSVDMVTKAFLDHYDVAVLVAGDQDFLDAIRVVKDFSGKKVAGYFVPANNAPPNTSEELIKSLDFKFPRLPTPLFDDLKLED
ncbi:NYN domain-containing protein [Geoglobus acetivorans]|uniref:NYN domain-containing protein n=1 Tax=Geoglobus acetivorans TaxID=565033 RepID=A0ABZ3H2M6_GEOAI|nr:NYN domain-containing protein [Geoglobus acetivorans]